MRFIDTMTVVFATLAIISVNVAFIIGLYYLGTWLFTFGHMFGVVSVSALIVVLSAVAVRVRLSMHR